MTGDETEQGTPVEPSRPRAAIYLIILNWNNYPDTLKCLASLEQVQDPPYHAIVVDNGSEDGSEQVLRDRYPGLQIIQTGRNLGYAGGNNAGIRHALAQGADYVCILNNDVAVEPGFLRLLLVALQQKPAIGIATPLIAEDVEGGRVWALGSAVDWRTATVTRCHAGEPVASWRQLEPFEVEIASGAAMMVKREVLERTGLLDESFFLYYEEVDWCLRARQAGYQVLAVPSAVVWHKVSATLGKTSPIIDYYMLRNHLHLIVQHWSGVRRFYPVIRTVARNMATVAAYTVKSHQGSRIPSRNARLMALRDALLSRWGKMGPDVAVVCSARGHR
jgi:GT2 family glycosyltransferase